jgi:hypothetical protein
VKIVYRFHPFFDYEVTVLRRTRHGGEAAVLVQVDHREEDRSDPELRISVPVWMLDQAACWTVVARDLPRIDVNALVHLRTLVDGLAKSAGQDTDASGSMMAKGDRHETRNRKPTQTTRSDTASETADA